MSEVKRVVYWETKAGITVTLFCDDCRNILPQLKDGAVGAVITDPPYGVGIEYASYEDTPENRWELLRAVIPECRRVARFTIMPCGGIRELGQIYREFDPDWLVAWVKGSPGTPAGVGFNDWEPHVVWGRPSKSMHDVFHTRCGFEIDGHPCPKPLAWALWLVGHGTRPGETVLDPFMGSGTVGVACVRLGRSFVGIEIDPGYFELACRRIIAEGKQLHLWDDQELEDWCVPMAAGGK